MNRAYHIALLTLFFVSAGNSISAQTAAKSVVHVDFFGQEFNAAIQPVREASFTLRQESIRQFYDKSIGTNYNAVIQSLNHYRETQKPDDWLFYQLIRRTVQQISPKENDYFRYTLFKWFFLTRTGYDAILTISSGKMLFYVQCNENIYNIPNRVKDGKQYVCLNYHDYGQIDFARESFEEVDLPPADIKQSFSYKVTRVPDVKASEYLQKNIHFSYQENDYHFRVKLSPQIQKLFVNYPVVDFESYLNIPMSRETYNSLIPQLKKNVRGLSTKNGVDYLMRFTRYAFLFEPDSKKFGGEKRLSPEQTLLYDESDCEDRVSLFFYLVKEIYDLPMIVVAYPDHVTVGVEFDKPVGSSIVYNGRTYSVCEPTPQKEDLSVGQIIPELKGVPYQVAYVYQPRNHK